MTEDSLARGRRGLSRHESVSLVDASDEEPTVARVTSTPFDAEITVAAADAAIEYSAVVRLPTIDRVTTGGVADVVVDGWADTLRRRVEAIGAITEAGHDLDPTVEWSGDDRLVARVTFTDLDPHRGANDAVAFTDYVEGVYVQGVIPGYDYEEPVAGLIDSARAAGGSSSP